MSDFEINCSVARALGMEHAFFFSKSEDDFDEEIEVNKRGPIWQSGKTMVNGYRVSNGNCFNPCNSWADAGPIIDENNITIVNDNPGRRYAVNSLSGYNDGASNCKMAAGENGLRAAMIVFLMMQEKK